MKNYYSESEGSASRGPPRRGIFILLAVIAFFVLISTISQIISLYLNVQEFGTLFIRPFYYAVIGGLVLSIISFVRVDVKNKRSIFWWALSNAIPIIRTSNTVSPGQPNLTQFKDFQLTLPKFAIWQVTKILIASILLTNINVGMTIIGMTAGWSSGISHLPYLFTLPFFTPPSDMVFAQQNIIPMVPALTLLVSPILGALGTRLILLVGITQLLKAASSTLTELGSEFKKSTAEGFDVGPDLAKIKLPTSTIEALVALFLFWTAFNMFFPSYIDYNSKFVIAGVCLAGIAFAAFSYLDSPNTKRIIKPSQINSVRIGAIILIALLVGASTGVQGSIADTRKVEWNGPYSTQEIAVNRYLANLESVKEVPYNFSLSPLPPNEIKPYVQKHSDVLDTVRLWDLKGAEAKLKPEIGLIPYVDFQDTDILRFNGSLYWSASLKPILPETVEASNRWYNEHLVYTHVPNGFLLLDGHDGKIVDTADFFDQRKIYYGEGGLLSDVWSAFPADRQTSDELNGHMYSGSGGIDIPPPLSWIFEPNWLLSRPFETIHTMRYKDVHEKMELLFPYFFYEINGRPIDMYPVTDGKETYWLMPLMTAHEADRVPWSQDNYFVRHVGYSLINTYDGDISLYIIGDDYYSDLFKLLYSDYIEEDVPDWLKEQTRYPEELFNYRVDMYNFYHITDAATFIEAREFFETPAGLDTYFIEAKPPGFEENKFIGLLSLQLRGSPGQNLAGYMIIENDFDSLGDMTFFEVPLDASTKLLGPTAILEALERNPDFATLRTLLRSPRVGDNILYRVGDHDVYFLPVYTAGAGGVVTQLGTVAAVGATFTGEYYIGFGDTPEEAFEEFLIELSGVESNIRRENIVPVSVDKDTESQLVDSLTANGVNVVRPDEIPSLFKFNEHRLDSTEDVATTQNVIDEFISKWITPYDVTRVYYWEDDEAINYGSVITINGVSELHYISIAK